MSTTVKKSTSSVWDDQNQPILPDVLQRQGASTCLGEVSTTAAQLLQLLRVLRLSTPQRLRSAEMIRLGVWEVEDSNFSEGSQ